MVDFILARGFGAVGEYALTEKTCQAQFGELIGGKIDIVDLEQASLDGGIQKNNDLVMAAFRAAFVKTRAKFGNPVRRADYRALRLDDLGRGDLEGQHLAELHQRLAKVVGAVEHIVHVLEDRAALFLDQRFEQLFLVGEVDIDRALGNAGLAGDVVHRRRFKALVDEDTTRAFDDLAALDRVLSRRRAAATQAIQQIALVLVGFGHNVTPRKKFEPIGSIALDMGLSPR
ncbi:hypothetical protein BQ8482_110305 [Mesorhizobium delmotii]|uniref:Uncharacterized protein n=1 Tax=Mesorhizobium delmotii TaxID=1631247 RepID=A0A2P9AB66_9HYPH|nr:hypothetical protein BQ8482_110305 [Mesorhizobium delmotii]